MALTAKVITGFLDNDSSPGYADFTASGFGTPDVALVFVSNSGSGVNPNTVSGLSIGFWDGTSQLSVGVSSLDNQADTRTARTRYTDKIAAAANPNDGATPTLYADYTISNITDGVRITLGTDNTSVQRATTVVLLKGVINKTIGSFTRGNTTSAQDINTIGFKPDLVFVIDGNRTATGVTTQALLSFGVAHNNSSDSVSQGCVSFSDGNNDSAAVVNTSVNDNCAARFYFANGVSLDRTTTISNFDSSGFSITDSQGTITIIDYLALELPDPDDAYVAIVDSRTSTGTTEPYTGTGFTPIIVGLFGNLDTSTNSTSSSPTGAMSYGWTDGATQQSLITGDQDNEGTSNVFSRYDSSNVLNLRSHDDTVDALASYSIFGSDGWTLNYSDGSASARKMLAVAIGNSVTITEAAGSASGTGTASGVGASTWSSVASAAGTATAEAVGSTAGTTVEATASAAGAATAAGIGAATAAGVGASTGAATASGVASATAAGVAASAGTGAASGVGASTAASVASAAGAATVEGQGATGGAIQSAAASAAGVATAAGVGASTAAGVASAAGTATATAVGADGTTFAEGVGSSSGTSTAAGAGAAIAAGVGTATGVASILGVGGWTYPAVGSAAGTSTVAGVGTDATVTVAGWLCGTASVYPALNGTPNADPYLTGTFTIYPQGCS